MDDLVKWFEDLPTWAKVLIPAGIAVIFLLAWQPWKKEETQEGTYTKAQSLYQPVAAGTSVTPEPMPYRLGEGYAIPSGWSFYTQRMDETDFNIPPEQEPKDIYVFGPTVDIELAKSTGLTEGVKFVDISSLPSEQQIAMIQKGGIILGGVDAPGGISLSEEEKARRAGADITRLGGPTRYETLALYRQWYSEQFGV